MLKFIGSIAAMAIIILLVGALVGKNYSDTAINKNDNSNTVIFSGYSKPIEKEKKKININTANLQDFKDLEIGIGEGKYKKIVNNRPFTKVSQLITRRTVGPVVYHRLKDIAVVD